ncbi:hypothetical protein [Algoriphagus aquimarinus]|uniref:Natural product n=1 Tax=Algoriphagus aquimarinus TaxID=237018 RepID=A0A5C7AET0_9BACT|nr:hypothetical protein [Algoriphagus aquimarinus]TXE06439.1 hypothetical protein ESV85_16815 [Algoriphagus aquimarinus]
MKKLSLGKLKLASVEVLQRSQMVNIYGGSGSVPDCIDMKCGSDYPTAVCCGGTSCDSITNGYCKPNPIG